MKDHLSQAIEIFNSCNGHRITENVISPAQRHTREVNLDYIPLNKAEKEVFHLIAEKFLWIMKRARPDLEPSVSFLCNRVSKLDEDN